MTDIRNHVHLRFEAQDLGWIERIAGIIEAGLPDGDGLRLGASPERAQPPYIRTGLAEVAAPTRSDAVYMIRELLHDVDDVWITVLGNPDQGEPDMTLTDEDFNL
jgi:hypothetical protein